VSTIGPVSAMRGSPTAIPPALQLPRSDERPAQFDPLRRKTRPSNYSMPNQVLTCILNDKAGSNNTAEARALIGRVASERGWEARVLLSSSGSSLPSLAEQACAAGGLVVSGGGDGTIAAVAAALVGKDAVLGVLPMGTLNHFAKDLGIPLELEKAVQTLFTGKVARVDVGEVNGRVFLNNSSIGFYPRLVQERERQQRQGRRRSSTIPGLRRRRVSTRSSTHSARNDYRNFGGIWSGTADRADGARS
jgi:diacylglycerol kinase family enzyme